MIGIAAIVVAIIMVSAGSVVHSGMFPKYIATLSGIVCSWTLGGLKKGGGSLTFQTCIILSIKFVVLDGGRKFISKMKEGKETDEHVAKNKLGNQRHSKELFPSH